VRGMSKKKLGLFLGRFQPFHQGHLFLIDYIFKENYEVVICIGSAQKAEPLTISERHERLEKQLDILGFEREKYRIVDLVDPNVMGIWPKYVKDLCGITDETDNTFYRGDDIPDNYRKDLEGLGFKVEIIKRIAFYHCAPNGLYYVVSSATEIRSLNEKFGDCSKNKSKIKRTE
jgi:cytidyltransferase-like protein